MSGGREPRLPSPTLILIGSLVVVAGLILITAKTDTLFDEESGPLAMWLGAAGTLLVSTIALQQNRIQDHRRGEEELHRLRELRRQLRRCPLKVSIEEAELPFASQDPSAEAIRLRFESVNRTRSSFEDLRLSVERRDGDEFFPTSSQGWTQSESVLDLEMSDLDAGDPATAALLVALVDPSEANLPDAKLHFRCGPYAVEVDREDVVIRDLKGATVSDD